MSAPSDSGGTFSIQQKDARPQTTILDRLLRSQDDDDPSSRCCIPANVEHDPERIIVSPDGRVFHDIVVTFKRSDVERMRQGYACLQCWEKFDSSWPERCPACGYEVRGCQAEQFERDFAGYQWVGSRLDMGEEQERLADWHGRERHNPQASILVPEWVRSV